MKLLVLDVAGSSITTTTQMLGQRTTIEIERTA